MKSPKQPGRFVAIGENIHTTRVVLKKGPRFATEGLQESVRFVAVDGEERLLTIPDSAKVGQDYSGGRIKHVKIAIQMAMGGGRDQETGCSYLASMVRSQELAGADFLDLNVDEISLYRADQEQAMAWLVGFVQANSDLPVSVDSSAVSVIEAGLDACRPENARPLLNSASLERLEALDLVPLHNARVIVTAAGDSSMPEGTEARVENASRIVGEALARGIPESDLFIDPLVFPIAVDGRFGIHVLDTIRKLRREDGSEVHITGGFSNVSFGIPNRTVINKVFLVLALEAGADSGIVDPLNVQIEDLFEIDCSSPTYRLAEDVLMGRDSDCANYIRAWRNKELEPRV